MNNPWGASPFAQDRDQDDFGQEDIGREVMLRSENQGQKK